MLDRIERIESQLRLWGLERLTPQGEKEWTEDIYWLIEQALNAYKLEIKLEKTVEFYNNKLIK